jgi:hypothetical protein
VNTARAGIDGAAFARAGTARVPGKDGHRAPANAGPCEASPRERVQWCRPARRQHAGKCDSASAAMKGLASDHTKIAICRIAAQRGTIRYYHGSIRQPEQQQEPLARRTDEPARRRALATAEPDQDTIGSKWFLFISGALAPAAQNLPRRVMAKSTIKQDRRRKAVLNCKSWRAIRIRRRSRSSRAMRITCSSRSASGFC